MNPLLDPQRLPDFPALTPDAIAAALDEALAEHRSVVSDLVAHRPTTFAEAWLPYERADEAVGALWSAVSHLHAVADAPKLRAAYAAGQQRLVENHLSTMQNRGLYEVFAGIAASPAFTRLADEDRLSLQHAIRDFTLNGVALEPAARERFGAILVELSSLATEFSNVVLDATQAWVEHITDPARLSGISETDMAMFAAAAAARSMEGWAVTLQQPSVAAVLGFADDQALRERVYAANGTRASDQGPNAGQFDNSERIARILALRREAAELLGFSDPVAWSLETKMAASADEVLAFLRDLARRARPAAEAEMAEMQTFAAETLGIADLRPWDVSYVANKLREARFTVDEEQVRAYFPVERVMQGWKALLHRLFGITLAERDDVPLYHPDACYFDVIDASGQVVAGLYTDLFARQGKRGGAWVASARPRLHDGNVIRVPVSYLTCNFAPGQAAMPSLLRHTEIVTLLHETGHALHNMLTQVNRPSVGGTSGFEWDAIELPSQLLEDFAWDKDVLTGMSGHYLSGETLPGDLFDRMLSARRFQSGLFLLRQGDFGLFDLLIHLGVLGSGPVEVIEAVRDEVAVIRPPAWHRFPHAFMHIFAGSYASGYYSYLWAEVLAADGFDRFAEAGLVDRATGDLFRQEILARGATRPAAESFRAFRGRDADPQAMLRRNGLTTEPAQ